MSTDGQPLGTARKVPAWRTAAASYRFVFANLDRFAVLACVPVLIVFGNELAIHFIRLPLARWMFALVSIGAWSVFVVRWHRLVLLDDRGGAFKALLALHNLRVFAYVFVLFHFLKFAFPIIVRIAIYLSDFLPFSAATIDFLGTAPELTGRSVGQFEGLLAAMLIQTSVIILWYLALRFILVLPGAAIDRPMRIVDAWHELRGNSWRCIGSIIIVIGFPFTIVDKIVSLYWSGLTMGTFTVVSTELSSEFRTPMNLEDGIFAFSMTALNFFVTALAITALSIFYRHIIDGETAEGAAAEAP